MFCYTYPLLKYIWKRAYFERFEGSSVDTEIVRSSGKVTVK